MAIRLVRESSVTPNITNRDDVRMIRYAYGGYDGVVKGYGEELAATYSSDGIFHIGSGRIVLQGWEIDIDESGVDVALDKSSSLYYAIYLEIDLSGEHETIEIKSIYSSSGYDLEVDAGDDLTRYPNGVARMVLYIKNSRDLPESSNRPEFSLIEYNSNLLQILKDDLLSGILKVGQANAVNGVEMKLSSEMGGVFVGASPTKRDYSFITSINLFKSENGTETSQFSYTDNKKDIAGRLFSVLVGTGTSSTKRVFVVGGSSSFFGVEWTNVFSGGGAPTGSSLADYPVFTNIALAIDGSNSKKMSIVVSGKYQDSTEQGYKTYTFSSFKVFSVDEIKGLD